MKLPDIKVLDEKNKILKKVSELVTFPMSVEDKQAIEDMLVYLEMSQIDEEREKYDLRAGWGMSAIQLGIPKRYFVIAEELEAEEEDDPKEFRRYIIINPTVKSTSEELIFVGEGEGCLSVNRDVDGIVSRNARMTVTYQDIDGKQQEIRVREEVAVVFQHEIDHLDGILFTDKIDKSNPYKDTEKMREI